MTELANKTKRIHELINKSSLEHHIEYCDYLSNHLSHVLIAIHGLEASLPRIEEYNNLYIKGVGHSAPLEPFVQSGSCIINDDNWMKHLGASLFGNNKENNAHWFSAYKNYFTSKLNGSIEDTISKYLPKVISGLVAAAFHPLIHIGWGIYFNNKMMIIDGLSYLCYSYYDLYLENIKADKKLSPIEILNEIRNDTTFSNSIDSRGYQSSIRKITKNHREKLNYYASMWEFPENEKIEKRYQNIVDLCVSLHYACKSSDFFVLHTVTSVFGIKYILPLLDEPTQRKTLHYFWLSLIAAYIARGRPLPKRQIPEFEGEYKDWESLQEATVIYQDEHKVKLVFVCKNFSMWYPDNNDLYFKTAQETLKADWDDS